MGEISKINMGGVDYDIRDKVLEEQLGNINAKPMISVTYAELVALRNNGELIAGMQYRITDYVTTTAQENTRSAGHQFDVIVTADNENTLNEVARACLHEGDTYFSEAGANLAAWQIWYSLDNDAERFAWASKQNGIYNEETIYYRNPSFDTTNNGVLYYAWLRKDDGTIVYTIKENPTEGELTYDDTFVENWEIIKVITKGKGVIYRMIDEWNNDCPYDFKNIQFKRGVYDGGGIAPDGDEDMHYYLFTFSFRTENNEIIDTSIFGNNGRLLNDEGQVSGVFGNVIGQYMNYDYSIDSPTKTTQRLNDIVFYSHYDFDGDLYYGCYSNSFGNNCFSNSFGNNCNFNTFSDECCFNSLSNYCRYNSLSYHCNYIKLNEYTENKTVSVNSNGDFKVFNLADLADLLNS